MLFQYLRIPRRAGSGRRMMSLVVGKFPANSNQLIVCAQYTPAIILLTFDTLSGAENPKRTGERLAKGSERRIYFDILFLSDPLAFLSLLYVLGFRLR